MNNSYSRSCLAVFVAVVLILFLAAIVPSCSLYKPWRHSFTALEESVLLRPTFKKDEMIQAREYFLAVEKRNAERYK